MLLQSEGNGIIGSSFSGERWGAYTELLFLRARYYTPETGRFISKDPWQGDVEQPLTMHRYVYALANPLAYTDPSGHVPMMDDEQCAQGWYPYFCPRPPKGMYWKVLRGYWIGVYGHAVHERFADRFEKRPGVYGDDKMEFTWIGIDNRKHTAEVYSKWVENIKEQQVAAKLKYEGHVVWIKCPKGKPCFEKTEAKAKQGGWGVPLTPYQNVAYNEKANTDLKDNDTVCVRRLGALSVSDHGRKGGARWLDLYIGEHGYYDWGGSPGPQDKIWVLRPRLPSPTCQWDRCPVRWEELR